MKVGTGRVAANSAQAPEGEVQAPAVINPVRVDEKALRFLKGPETRTKTSSGGKSLLRTLLNTKPPDPPDVRTKDERQDLDGMIHKLRRPNADQGAMMADIAKRYAALAPLSDETSHELNRWLANFPAKLTDVPPSMVEAWIPHSRHLSHALHGDLTRIAREDPQTASRLIGLYVGAVIDDHAQLLTRVKAVDGFDVDGLDEVRAEARHVLLGATDLEDDTQTRGVLRYLSTVEGYRAPTDWVKAALRGGTDGQLVSRVGMALGWSNEDVSGAAQEVARAHLLDETLGTDERVGRLLSFRRSADTLTEAFEATKAVLIENADFTDARELGSLLSGLGMVGKRPDASFLLDKWRAAGLDADRMRTFALENQRALSPATAADALHLLAMERTGGDPKRLADDLLDQARTAKNQSGGAVKQALQKGINVLLPQLGVRTPQLADAVLETARLAGITLPNDLTVIEADQSQLARAYRLVASPHGRTSSVAERIITASFSEAHAPDFSTLCDKLDAAIDAGMPRHRTNYHRSVQVAFERLCEIAGDGDGAELARIHDRLDGTLPAHKVPDEHLVAVYGRGDPLEQVIDRAVGELDIFGSAPARAVLKRALAPPHTTTPEALTYRLEKVMAKIESLAKAEEARIRSSKFRSSRQKAATTARTAVGKLVHEVAKEGYERLQEIGDPKDDRTALFVLLAPAALNKQSIRTLQIDPEWKKNALAGDQPYARAASLAQHFDPDVRKAATELLTSRQPNDLFETLASTHERNPARRVAHPSLAGALTVDAAKAMLGAPKLTAFDRMRRIDLLAKEYLATKTDPKLITDALVPAYEALVRDADFTDARLTQFLLELPVRFDGSGVDVSFPADRARKLFDAGVIDVERATDLLAHPDEAIQQEAARFLEARWDTHPTERTALLEGVRAKRPASNTSRTNDLSKAAWTKRVGDGLDLATSEAANLIARLEARTFDEVSTSGDIATLKARIPASMSRDVLVDRLVGTPEWIERDVLETAVDGYGSGTVPPGTAEVLAEAIGGFAGNPAKLVECLEGRVEPSAIAADVADDAAEGEQLLLRMRSAWQALDTDLKPKLLEHAMTKVFEASKRPDVKQELANRGIADPEEVFSEALKEHALDALAADPDAKDLGDKVQRLFEELPDGPRAKILTTLLLEPPTNDAPALIRRLAGAAGVVAVKAAQQMCEDPAVPERFRVELEDMRDQNPPMTPVAAWQQMPGDARKKVAALGATLGTGSVKQAMMVMMDDGVEALAAVVRAGVPEQIQETIGALRVLDDTKHLVDRIEPMLGREIDLKLEAEAFEALRNSPLGRAKVTSVPRVIEVFDNVLFRELSPGAPLSATLRKRSLDEGERQRLTQVHQLLVTAALEPQNGEDTFVLTDPHQGNLADDGIRVGLFDPGQYENLTAGESELFVRLLAAFSRDKWHRKKKAQLVSGLAPHCQLAPNEKKVPSVRDRLDAAYAATFSEPDATVGRKLHLFLLDASKRGVAIPNGYFGLAKMLHSLQSQAEELGLEDVVSKTIGELYIDHLGPLGRVYRAFGGSA